MHVYRGSKVPFLLRMPDRTVSPVIQVDRLAAPRRVQWCTTLYSRDPYPGSGRGRHVQTSHNRQRWLEASSRAYFLHPCLSQHTPTETAAPLAMPRGGGHARMTFPAAQRAPDERRRREMHLILGGWELRPICAQSLISGFSHSLSECCMPTKKA